MLLEILIFKTSLYLPKNTKEFFFDKEVSVDEENTYDKKKKSSYFTPNEDRDKWLDMYIDCVRADIVQGLYKRGFDIVQASGHVKSI